MLIKQAGFIIAAVTVVFLWQSFSLSGLTIPLIGLLVLAYLIMSRFKRKQADGSRLGAMDNFTIFTLTTLILVFIFTTGALNSPLFFLLYFICFGITFVMLPETVFIFLIGTIFLFLPHIDQAAIMQDSIKLASLALISPLAFFFGKEYRVVEHHQDHDQAIAKKIISEAGTVLKQEETKLTPEEKTQLADIIQEGEALQGE
ncbi:MAG: hypothetical protein AAB478_03610 [Patescibacteria group bacterium]